MDLLKIVLKLLVNKARDKLSENLRYGDSSEEALRRLVIREAAEIRESLKSLLLKDLNSAVSFLERGLIAMENYERNPREDTKEYARECFKSSSELATQAFCNTALSIKDQILAMKINVSSTILQLQSNPEMARDICLNHFLKDLHALPAVVYSFERYYDSGGLMKLWKGDEREEIVKAVIQINRAVIDFILLNYITFDRWPNIHTGDKMYITLKRYRYDNVRLLTKYDQVTKFEAAVTRRRQLVLGSTENSRINVKFLNLDTGKFDREFLHESVEQKQGFCQGVTLDEYDNIYLGVMYLQEDPKECWGMFVEVFSLECQHLKTITVIPMDDPTANGEPARRRLQHSVGLSAAHGKLCVTNCTDLWLFTSDSISSDHAISHKNFNEDIRKCWIFGEKIIFEDYRNARLFILNSSLEIERRVYIDVVDNRYWNLTLDKITGYFLACNDEGVFVFTQYGERLLKIALPYDALKSLGLHFHDCRFLTVPATATTEEEIVLLMKKGSETKKVFIVSE